MTAVLPFLLLWGEKSEHPAVSTAVWSENFQQLSLLPPRSPLAFSSVTCRSHSPLERVSIPRSSLDWRKRRSYRTENRSRIPNCPCRAYPSYLRKLLLSLHFLPFVLQPCSDSSYLFLIKVRYCC